MELCSGEYQVVQVAAGGCHSIVLLDNGQVVCWGDNENGQCNPPANLCDGEKQQIIQIAAGGFHSIALLEDGNVVCWGDNDDKQCSPPEQDLFLVPPTGMVKSASKR